MESRPRFMSCCRLERGGRGAEWVSGPRAAVGGGWVRTDFRADARTLQPIDNHPVFRLQAVADHAQALIERPKRYLPRLDRIVVLDDENDLARLIARNRGIRQQQRVIGRASDQTDPAELPRQDRKVLVRDHRAPAERSG